MDTQKIIQYKDLASVQNKFYKKTVVLCGGCFDVFHYGHLQFLKKASLLGNLLVVVLESDEFIIKIKGKKPVHTQVQRAEILSHLDVIDVIITIPLFGNDDYDRLIRQLSPHIIAITEGDKKADIKKIQAEHIHAKLTVIEKEEGFSSSLIFDYETISGT